MGLKDQIEAKQRKRLLVPIQLSDPSRDYEAWMGTLAALRLAQHTAEDSDEDASVRLEEAQRAADAAEEAHAAHYARIELQAMPRDLWHQATVAYSAEDGEDIDWARALGPLLAESCVDPELQDSEWWTKQLEKPEWSEGDTDSLRAALLQLNVFAAEASYPKD